jgi:hypothetical protein
MDDAKFYKALGYLGLAAIIIPLTVLYTAWVGQTLWNWYMPALGLPELTLWQAFGIDLVVSFMTMKAHYGIIAEHTQREQAKLLGLYALGPLFILAIGGVVKHWVM